MENRLTNYAYGKHGNTDIAVCKWVDKYLDKYTSDATHETYIVNIMWVPKMDGYCIRWVTYGIEILNKGWAQYASHT